MVSTSSVASWGFGIELHRVTAPSAVALIVALKLTTVAGILAMKLRRVNVRACTSNLIQTLYSTVQC